MQLPKGMFYVEVLGGLDHGYASTNMDKRQTALYHKTVCKDEKIMKLLYKGLNDNGKPSTIMKVLEKQ